MPINGISGVSLILHILPWRSSLVEGYGRNAKNVYSQWVFPSPKQTKFTKKATFIVTLKQAIDPIVHISCTHVHLEINSKRTA